MHYVLHKYLQVINIIEFLVKPRSNFYLMMSTVSETIYCIPNVCVQSLNNIFRSSADMVKSHTERRIMFGTQARIYQALIEYTCVPFSSVETNTTVSHVNAPLVASIIYEDIS